MIRIFIIIVLCLKLLMSASINRTFDCTKIFEQRKQELIERLENIDEQEQSLTALTEATKQLLNKKKIKIDIKMADIKAIQQNITQKENNIKKLIKKNKQLLEKLKKKRLSKISTMYAKMKPASAAQIFSQMQLKEATDILNTLPPKILGKIFSKMNAKKAANLTHEMGLTPKK